MKKLLSRIRNRRNYLALLFPISMFMSIRFFIDGNMVYGVIHGIIGISSLISWWIWRGILKDLEKMPDRYEQEEKEEENV